MAFLKLMVIFKNSAHSKFNIRPNRVLIEGIVFFLITVRYGDVAGREIDSDGFN